METDSPDNIDDRIQRSLNQAKKRELEEKYGANFSEENSKLPSDIESQWLNSIEEFERQYDNSKQVTIREFTGNPAFTTLADIPPEQLEHEVRSVLEFLKLHNISVDFLCETPDATAYQFLTVELMDHEIDDVRIEGMMHCFIYEEFHPNDEYDAVMFAERFLWDLFERQAKNAAEAFAKDEIFDGSGKRISQEQMQLLIQSFLGQYAIFTNSKHEKLKCTVDGDYATVTFLSEWSGLKTGTMEIVAHAGTSTLRMKRSPYTGWDVIQVNAAGW